MVRPVRRIDSNMTSNDLSNKKLNVPTIFDFFSNILVPVDGSNSSFRILNDISLLAEN